MHSGKCGRALKTEKQKKSFDIRHILLPINLMINFILFCFRAEIKAFFYFIYILFSDVKITGQVAGKIIDHLSERYDCKNQDPPTTTCRGNYFAFNHAYFQLA